MVSPSCLSTRAAPALITIAMCRAKPAVAGTVPHLLCDLADGSRREGVISGSEVDAVDDDALRVVRLERCIRAFAHVDNPTLANEFIFDWIASRIGVET